MSKAYDLIALGGGSAGLATAQRAAEYGARALVIERGPLGGTCVNVGCVPKKLFVYASHVAEDVEDGAGFGWQNNGELTFDFGINIDIICKK